MMWLVVLFAIAAVVAQQRAVAGGRLSAALAAWLKAGRTPLEALAGLRDSTESPAIARGLNDAVRQMEAGAPLSHALAGSGLVLPASFLDGLRAVEESGHVTDWLELEAERFAWRAEVRGKGILGLVYPVLTLFVLFETGVFLSTYVLPTFVSLFEGMGIDLPWQMHAVRMLRLLDRPQGQLVVGALVLIVLLALMYPRAVPLFNALGRLPFLRRFRELAGAEEAASMLGTLMRGRLSLPAALHTAASAVSTKAWREALVGAEKDVLMGETLSQSLRGRAEMPPLFVEMCALGEKTEDLPQTLTELGTWYQEQLERFVHRAVRLGEVALMWSLGLCVCVYALGVWLPMVGLLGAMVP